MAINKLNLHVQQGQLAEPSQFNSLSDKIDEVIDAVNDGNGGELEGRVTAVETQLSSIIIGITNVTISASPSVIYKKESTSISISATCEGSTPSLFVLKEDSLSGSQIASVENNNSVSGSKTVSVTENSKTFFAEATVEGQSISKSISVSARYPVYAGFGSTADSVLTASNKLSPRKTATGSYSKTSSSNGVHFYILIPSDIAVPATFVMGGAPFAIDQQSAPLVTADTNYTVLKSGEIYNSGTTLNIQAS